MNNFHGWISVEDALPENDDTVLIIKQLKDGRRQIGLGYCIVDYHYDNPVTHEKYVGPYWVCGGNNNVIFWQKVPKMPEGVDGK